MRNSPEMLDRTGNSPEVPDRMWNSPGVQPSPGRGRKIRMFCFFVCLLSKIILLILLFGFCRNSLTPRYEGLEAWCAEGQFTAVF